MLGQCRRQLHRSSLIIRFLNCKSMWISLAFNTKDAILLLGRVADWADICGLDGGTPGLVVLCELTRDLYPALPLSCVVEDSASGNGFQVFIERGCRLPQLASRSPAPRERRRGQKEVPDQFTIETSRSVTKPEEPSLDELCRYTVPRVVHNLSS